jgi:hypothetical protein
MGAGTGGVPAGWNSAIAGIGPSLPGGVNPGGVLAGRYGDGAVVRPACRLDRGGDTRCSEAKQDRGSGLTEGNSGGAGRDVQRKEPTAATAAVVVAAEGGWKPAKGKGAVLTGGVGSAEAGLGLCCERCCCSPPSHLSLATAAAAASRPSWR